jgi:tetratricopeptide (TPR) repeat protein
VQGSAMFIPFIFVFSFLSPLIASDSDLDLDPNQTIDVAIDSPKWNKDSQKLDDGVVVLRERKTNRIALIKLTETAPDSGSFTGRYSIRWTDLKKISPEFSYSESQSLDDSFDAKKMQAMMQSKNLTLLHPIRNSQTDRQSVSVFRSKKERDRALEAFKEAEESKKASELKKSKSVVAQSVLDTQKMAELQKKREEEERAAVLREIKRKQELEDEAKRKEELIKQQKALSEAEKRRRKVQAIEFSKTALDFFRLGEFEQAGEFFNKSVELDPENKSYYYSYGITLFRNKQYNKSIVTLGLAETKPEEEIDKKYYLALNYYNLKEFDRALKQFDEVRQMKQQRLSPVAAFYMGQIHFEKVELEEAKPYFEEVLDTTDDPKLDRQAESRLDDIAKLIIAARLKDKKVIVVHNSGIQYDSNVLSTNSDVGDGEASDSAAARYSGDLTISWKPVYNDHVEFGFQLLGLTLYSFTDDTAIKEGDTLYGSLQLPFVYKTDISKKVLRLELTPTYEQTYLYPEGGEKQELSITTSGVNNKVTLAPTDSWFASLIFNYLTDKGETDEDQNAVHTDIGTSQLLFLDKDKTKILVADLKVSKHDAEGDDVSYNKTTLSLNYLMPLGWNVDLTAGITYYKSEYPTHTEDRSDSNITTSIDFRRPIFDWLYFSINGSYSSNTSNVETNQYNKYIVGSVLTVDIAL